MMLNPIIAMLHNTKVNTYHPIIFAESPLPGGNPDAPIRHKSKMHHTTGFSSRDEAVKNAEQGVEEIKKEMGGTAQLALSEDIPWNGEGIPAMVAFFVKTDEGLKIASKTFLQQNNKKH